MNNKQLNIMHKINILSYKITELEHMNNLYMRNYEIMHSSEYMNSTTLSIGDYEKVINKLINKIKRNELKIHKCSVELEKLQQKLVQIQM